MEKAGPCIVYSCMKPKRLKFVIKVVDIRTSPGYDENLSVIIFILFHFICHTIITKNIGKEEKKTWRGDLTETIGAYEMLGLLELWARAVSHQLKKRRPKVEDGKTYELFSYLLNNLIFSFFLKEERDWELMTLLSSELKNLGPWKRARTSSCLYDNMVDGKPGNFLYCKSGIDCFERNCY